MTLYFFIYIPPYFLLLLYDSPPFSYSLHSLILLSYFCALNHVKGYFFSHLAESFFYELYFGKREEFNLYLFFFYTKLFLYVFVLFFGDREM